MGLLLLSLLVACLQFDGSQAQNRVCTNATFPQELYVKEGSQNGTVIFNVSDSNDVKLIRYPTPEPPAFIAVRDGYVYLNATLDLDGNMEWCSQLQNSGRWMIYLICNDSKDVHDVIIYINRTDDFPPEFTASFTQTIQEMKQIDSVVNTVEGTQVTDRDCMSNVQIGSNTVFAIESGNTDDAFALSGLGERSGEIVVHRLLDYDQGDRRFLLNISVTDLHAPNMTSYTTLEVNIIDIDDNDPVFNDTHYVLHVQEKNQSAVGLWTSTEPPLAVFDPDVDVVPTDPLTISLLNPNDTSILEVNKTTGLIRLSRIFDREQQASFFVVLKVQQTINSFRSSTTTLTVVVDDINDNRPLFQPYTYDVTMAEHSASGTSVAVVSATDKDLGDNAAFNYTLESGESMFLLTTEKIGQLRFGVLSVRDPALLDRENSSHIMVTVSTTELTAIDGQQCSRVHCNATVNITLLDINDNSPVFGQSRYDVVENSIQPHVVIITVNATDADEGANAKLTYKLQSFAAAGCHDVIIDRYSGDVSFNNTVTQSEECPVMVTACDNPADPSQRHCTFVPLQISVHIPNVRLEAPVPPDVLRADRAALQRNLSAVLDVRITINDILSHTDRGSSSLYISARNTSTQETLSTDTLQRLVDEKAGEIAALFARYKLTTTIPPPDDFPPLIIALFVVAAVLLVAFAVAIVYLCTGHKSQQRQKRLLQRLLTAHGLYRNVDDVGKVESGEACLLHQTGQETTRNVEVVNPVFQDDGAFSPPSSPEVTPPTDSFPDTLDGRRLSQTATTELKGRVPRETDSGVPSDRENGAESGSDSGSESVSVPSGERSADRSAGSAYLEAVLSSSPLPESGGNVSPLPPPFPPFPLPLLPDLRQRQSGQRRCSQRRFAGNAGRLRGTGNQDDLPRQRRGGRVIVRPSQPHPRPR